MQKLFFTLVTAAVMIGLLSGIGSAAPSFLSTSGNILTPNDLLLDAGVFSPDIHFMDFNNSANVIGANIGVTPNLELGIARFDPDVDDGEETFINAKYLVLAETSSRPSVVIGTVDATGELDPRDDPSIYFVLGKNLTPVASGLTGEPVEPLRVYLGVGTGIYNGLFAGANWAFNPRASLMLEIIGELDLKYTISEKTVFNAGLRVALTDNIRADIALLDSEDIGFGISFYQVGL